MDWKTIQVFVSRRTVDFITLINDIYCC